MKLAIGLGFAILMSLASSVSAMSYDFTYFEVPGAKSTFVSDINNNGDVVGGFIPSDSSRIRGFIRDNTGVFTTFHIPGSLGAYGFGLNDAGVAVGRYTDPIDSGLAFLRETDGTFRTSFTAFDEPVKIFTGINNAGQTVGFTTSSPGFIFDGDATYTEITLPGSIAGRPVAINNIGSVTGVYSDGTFLQGFIRDPDGNTELLSIPGAYGYLPEDINDAGDIVGHYLDDGSGDPETIHGFLRTASGEHTFFPTDLALLGINNFGQIAGASSLGSFIATPIPLPASIWLLGAAAACLAAIRRRD